MIFDNTCRSLDFLSSQNEKWEFFRQITADTLIWLAAVGRLLTTEIHTALVWRKKHSYLTRVYAQTHYGRSVPILCTNYEALFDFDVAGMSLEKLFDEISMLEISKYYIIFYFDFFQRTKLKQPRGQRQLLENKQILRNISRFLTSRFRQIAFLMTCQQHEFTKPSFFLKRYTCWHLLFSQVVRKILGINIFLS